MKKRIHIEPMGNAYNKRPLKELNRNDYDRYDFETWNAKHLWHPMGHPQDSIKTPPLIINKGDGVYIEDNKGNKYIDGVAGLWNINCGYNRNEIKNAITEQLNELVYFPAFSGTTHPRCIELGHNLMRMLQPEHMRKVMFSSGGSDAMETALRIARQYWKIVGYKDRYKFISLKQGYHGTHFGAAAISGNTKFRRNYEPGIPGCSHIDSPWLYRNPYTQDPTRLGQIIANLLDREIEFQGPDTVAAFIAEPVQGAGGVIVPPDNFFQLCRQVCDKHGVLFIVDEVVTGFGRTGCLFGSRGWGIKPDIITLAKGISSGYIPLGATLFNSKIEEAFKYNRDSFGNIAHGYTYSGHPLACAAALATLNIVEKEELPANSKTQGNYLMKLIKPFEQKYPSVGDVRGKGLMIAIEFVKDKKTKEPASNQFVSSIAKSCMENGVFIRTSGNLIIISPPLIIQNSEIEKISEALQTAIESN